MTGSALITGGAGFIGSHLADQLLEHGYRVRVLDSLVPQVHGDRQRPSYLDDEVELVAGDIRDPGAVERALEGIDCVFHLAAAVGVGQSMYQVADYTSVNNLGTAVLLEALAKSQDQRLVVASSMSVYGEGLYRDERGDVHEDVHRTSEQLARHEWEPRGPEGHTLRPVPTPEHKLPRLESVYALSKFDQERMSLMLGRAYDIPTVALRFFNVYGPRQALSNPYTGVLAIFASRYLNNRAPLIFEDGNQRRDFVHVRDVARACCMAMERLGDGADGLAINIGSGREVTVREVAERLGAAIGASAEPLVTGEYRVGDIRHCTADIALARRVLGYHPEVEFQDGLEELSGWITQQIAVDRVDSMRQELAERGLTL